MLMCKLCQCNAKDCIGKSPGNGNEVHGDFKNLSMIFLHLQSFCYFT